MTNHAGMGIVLVIGQQTMFAAETVVVHQIGGALSLPQIALLRSIGGIGLVIVLARGVVRPVFVTGQLWLQVARGLTSAGYLLVFAYSFTRLPLTDATALSYSTPLYLTLFAPLLLGEQVGTRRWLGVVIGLFGAAIMIRPGLGSISSTHLLVFVGTSLNGLATVLTARLQRRDSPLTVMLYLNIVSILYFSPDTIVHATSVQVSPLLFTLLLFGPIGQYLGILALRHAEVSTLAPYTYVRLILAGCAAVFLFGEMPSIWTVVGASIIIASCFLAAPTRQIPARLSRAVVE